MTTNNFFVYCPNLGFEAFETLDDALDAANERIQEYLDDGWSEDVTSVCAGKITHKSKMCDQVYPVGEIDEDGLDEEGIYWDPDWGYKCNYKMMPTEPSHDVAGLVVPSRDDLIQCLLATSGQSEGTTADAILSMFTAAHQGGEL